MLSLSMSSERGLYYDSQTSISNHWPCTLEPTPSFDMIHLINWCVKCLFSFSKDCPLLYGSLALEALLIGMHFNKRYKNAKIQCKVKRMCCSYFLVIETTDSTVHQRHWPRGRC